MYDRHTTAFLRAFIVFWFAAIALVQPATAQFMCFQDLDADGDFDGLNESGTCSVPGLCPIDKVACTVSSVPAFVCPTPGEILNACTPTGGFCEYPNPVDPVDTLPAPCVANPTPPPTPSCPLDPAVPCVIDTDGVSKCSLIPCQDVSGTPTVDESRPREHVIDDGARDPFGNCVDELRIFNGFEMDCRPPGLQTVFMNCCKDRGRIIHDSTGGGLAGSITTAQGTIQGFTAIFSGMKAAHAAFQAGATASSAASSGASAFIGAFDPTSLVAAAAIALIVDLLNLGCDAQDMETGTLRGSGMCHEVGEYCSVRIFGCVQKKKAHCCFNSMLGRIIQEQGRPQLAAFTALPDIWGTPEDPICRGFTPEEFQALDFSAMDLSEYYGELALEAEAAMQTYVQDGIDEYTTTNGVN
ncbi:MAG: conjugal transfer protein TraN [Pseudomonadota bacterium]